MCFSYCHQYKWAHGRPVLVRPYDAQFMYYEAMKSNIDHRDSAAMTPSKVLDWLAARLSEHVHKITSVVELRRDWLHLEPGQRRRRTQQDVKKFPCLRLHSSLKTPFLKFLVVPQKYWCSFLLAFILNSFYCKSNYNASGMLFHSISLGFS